MNDLIQYIETETKATADFHIDCAETLMRESNTLLTLLLGGAGGTLALFVSLNEKAAAMWLQTGTMATSCYLFLIATFVILKCLKTRPIYPPANEPLHLLNDDFEPLQIRKAELKNKQACIDANRTRNDSVGFWLNRLRAFVAATPLVFGLSALVAY